MKTHNLEPMDGKTAEHLKGIVMRLSGAVAVLGDFMLDEYIFGAVHRISPESPVPVVEFVSNSFTLGGAGNVVANVRALGGSPVPFGIVGADEAARILTDVLRNACGVDAQSLVVDADRPTTVKRRIVAQHQQLLRIDHESRLPADPALQDRLIANLRASIADVRTMVVSDYNKGVVTRALFDRVLEVAVAAGVPLILDPKEFDLAAIGPVTVITPNEKEAERFSGCRIVGDAGAEEAGCRLLEKTGARHILITRGERGMSLFSADAGPLHIPTQAREVYDVTGAGDTVVATLAVALAAGATVPEAARLANLAAGVVVGKVGTASVSREELESALNGEWPNVHPAQRRSQPAR